MLLSFGQVNPLFLILDEIILLTRMQSSNKEVKENSTSPHFRKTSCQRIKTYVNIKNETLIIPRVVLLLLLLLLFLSQLSAE